jgi:acyl-CoA dehydrogenase
MRTLEYIPGEVSDYFPKVEQFVEQECIPSDTVYHAQLGEGEQRWKGHPSIIDDLKARARKLGLWNMFLPRNHFKEGAGFSNLEYGLMAEYLGKSRVASEVCWLQLQTNKTKARDFG